MSRTVAIKLATEGKAQIKQDFVDIGDAGEAQAKRYGKAFQRAGEDALDAMRRQAQAADKLAALAPKTDLQQRVQSNASTGYTGSSARDSAAAIRELLNAEDQLNARTERMLALLDPTYAAQKRFNSAISEAKALLDAGRISTEQYAAAEALATKELNAVAVAHGRVGVSAGQLRAGTQQLAYQISDVATSFAGGINPMMIFAQQSGQVASSIALMQGEAKGVAGFLTGTWGAALLGAASIVGVLVSKSLDSADAADVMADHQKQLALVIDQTTGRIKEQSAALLLNQQIQAQGDVLNARRKLVAISGKIGVSGQTAFAAGEGTVDVVDDDPRIRSAIQAFNKSKDADALARALGKINANTPALKESKEQLAALAAEYVTASRQVQQFEAQQRVLTGTAKAGDNRIALGQFGPEKPDVALLDAEAKLAAAKTKREKADAQATITQIKSRKALEDGTITADQYRAAMTKADAAVNAITNKHERSTKAAGRAAEAMRVNADTTLDLARAYLAGGDAAVYAEARQKGATDAARRGIDQTAQIQRQLNILVADGIMKGAKAVDQLRGETAARLAVNDAVAKGQIAASDMDQALSTELTLRPLIRLQSIAEGDARKTLTETIEAQRKALADLQAQEARGDAQRATADARKQIADITAGMADIGKSPMDQAIEAARRAAESRADDRHYAGPERSDFVSSQVDLAKSQFIDRQARSMADQKRDLTDTIELQQVELSLIGKSADERDLILAKIQREQGLRRENVDLSSTEAQKLLALGVIVGANTIKIRNQKDEWQEITQVGENFLDSVLNVQNWNNWSDVGKRVLQDLASEFLKLAALDPLKNMLFGENLPTLGSVLSRLTSGSVSYDSLNATLASVGGGLNAPGFNAAGSEYFGGGATWVGEHGAELVNLPRGSKISTAAQSARMASAANGQGGNSYHFHLEGAVVTQDLVNQMNAIGAGAAMKGAYGGAQLAKRDRYREASRALPA